MEIGGSITSEGTQEDVSAKDETLDKPFLRVTAIAHILVYSYKRWRWDSELVCSHQKPRPDAYAPKRRKDGLQIGGKNGPGSTIRSGRTQRSAL